jgi:DNA-binding IclR family transcriptional regulator
MDLVNSVVKAVRILDLLKEHGPCSYTELLNKLAMPKSTLFKLLGTLEAEELVRRDSENGRYHLGVKLIEWGAGSRAQLEIRNIARPFMKELSETLDCTVHLTVMAHDEVLPIESCESGAWYWHHFKYPVAIGIPAPLHATGAGKAILAFMREADIVRIIRDKGLERYTASTIDDPESLKQELETIRRNGYAVSNAEHDDLIRSVAARNHDGNVVAALSVLGLVTRVTEDRVPEIARLVTKAAREVSRLCGFSVT